MSDKKLKWLLRIAATFLVASVVFCVFAMCSADKQKKELEQKRLDNETEIAMMQMPTFKPSQDAEDDNQTAEANAPISGEEDIESEPQTEKKVIVLDAGHGKLSSEMTSEEKTAEGYEYNESRGSWGEWRHYKNGTFGEDCYGTGCTELCPPNASCWYPMSAADRTKEPEINLNNALAAQTYLEEMGYEVRMTRTTNEQNPSMNKRVSYCFPGNDTSSEPDAAAYVCIHSNAGGSRGTSYISLEGQYRQSYISEDYISDSNNMGKIINDKVAEKSGLRHNGPIYSPYLILFNKCPVPIAYMEIGFFDDSSDLAVLRSSSDEIGKAIAEGVDEYIRNN